MNLIGETVETFFEEWDNAVECQEKYEDRIVELTEEMIKIQGTNYNPAFHDRIIRELARHEIVCEHYEYIIANNREDSPHLATMLKYQWAQLNKCRSLLGLDSASIVRNSKTKEKGQKPSRAKEALLEMLQYAKEEGDI